VCGGRNLLRTNRQAQDSQRPTQAWPEMRTYLCPFHSLLIANQARLIRKRRLFGNLHYYCKEHRDALFTRVTVRTPKKTAKRVSTTLRHMPTEFSEFFHVSWTGLLIYASVGRRVVLETFAQSFRIKLICGIEYLLALFENSASLVVADHRRGE
jgi:hypothetical protein